AGGTVDAAAPDRSGKRARRTGGVDAVDQSALELREHARSDAEQLSAYEMRALLDVLLLPRSSDKVLQPLLAQGDPSFALAMRVRVLGSEASDTLASELHRTRVDK